MLIEVSRCTIHLQCLFYDTLSSCIVVHVVDFLTIVQYVVSGFPLDCVVLSDMLMTCITLPLGFVYIYRDYRFPNQQIGKH